MRWHPKNVIDALAYPIRMAFTGERTSELFLRDARFLLLMIALIGVLIVSCTARWQLFLKRRNTHGPTNPVCVSDSHLSLVTVFCATTLIVWVCASGYYRYLAALEILTPAYLLYLSCYWAEYRRWLLPIVVVLLSLNAAWLRPPTPSRIRWEYSTKQGGLFETRKQCYFDLPTPALPADSNMIVMLGGAPMAYLIPFFPKEVRFVRPEGNLFPRSGAGVQQTLLLESIWRSIEEHTGNLFVLIPADSNAYQRIPPIFSGNSTWIMKQQAPTVLRPNTGFLYWLVPMKRRD